MDVWLEKIGVWLGKIGVWLGKLDVWLGKIEVGHGGKGDVIGREIGIVMGISSRLIECEIWCK